MCFSEKTSSSPSTSEPVGGQSLSSTAEAVDQLQQLLCRRCLRHPSVPPASPKRQRKRSHADEPSDLQRWNTNACLETLLSKRVKKNVWVAYDPKTHPKNARTMCCQLRERTPCYGRAGQRTGRAYSRPSDRATDASVCVGRPAQARKRLLQLHRLPAPVGLEYIGIGKLNA